MGTNASPRSRLLAEIRANVRIMGAAAGNIMAIIMVTQIARNSGALRPMVRSLTISLELCVCQITSAHETAEKSRSVPRIRRDSRWKGADCAVMRAKVSYV